MPNVQMSTHCSCCYNSNFLIYYWCFLCIVARMIGAWDNYCIVEWATGKKALYFFVLVFAYKCNVKISNPLRYM